MADPLSEKMNERCFEVVIPEIYTKIIPEYYTKPAQSDLPRVNGVPVSMEEYMRKYNNFHPDTPFIPDLVYNPPEQNKATAFQSIADMIDMLDNDIEFSIANAEQAYPKILNILGTYTSILSKVATTPERSKYLEKANNAFAVISECYERFKTRKLVARTGIRPADRIDTYDAIVKKFAK